MDRKIFYSTARALLFDGRLSQRQVDGIEAILNEWDVRRWSDVRWLAYMLATTYHETDRTIAPIAEYGKGQGRPYGIPDSVTGQVYYGRGFVQLTWKANYQKLGALVGVDLVDFPEKAMELPIATAILFDGMHDGLFTGVGLPRYFSDHVDDPVNARRIINGTDRAELIAGYHAKFLAALKAA
jgi:putative chitinase